MSTISLVLRGKTERIEASPEGFLHSLTFEAHLPPGEKLMSHAGEVVTHGYVEIRTNQPRFSGPMLMFSKAMLDPDTGKAFPPSISFYAAVPEDIFAAILGAPVGATYQLNLSTDLLGAIRFNDVMGLEKIWNTEQQNPVAVPNFEFAIAHDD
jgi:hypothetical protein